MKIEAVTQKRKLLRKLTVQYRKGVWLFIVWDQFSYMPHADSALNRLLIPMTSLMWQHPPTQYRHGRPAMNLSFLSPFYSFSSPSIQAVKARVVFLSEARAKK